MALWDLLTALCFVMPIAGALATVRDVQKGWAGYALAIIVGAVLGTLCAWAMRTASSKLATRSSTGPKIDSPWFFRALYFAAFVWIVIALFLGSWVTEASLHFI
jgi:hypothetical protein